MVVNQFHARVIDSLRQCAEQDESVLELLRIVTRSFPGLAAGGGEFLGDEQDRCFLVAAQSAYSFASLDAGKEEI